MIWPLGNPALRIVSCLINPRKISVVRERLSKKDKFFASADITIYQHRVISKKVSG
jgi:hypothetical protein